MASLYFLDRAVTNKRLSDFALAGLIVGMGLNFYYAFRIYAVMMIGFIALFVIARGALVLIRRMRGEVKSPLWPMLRVWLVPALATMFGALITITPIAQFALRNPDEFFVRTSTVSIFNKRDEPDLIKALTSNLTKHVLMFNIRGDGNGRHNIPGEPMLDPITGALAVLGAGFALSRLHKPSNLLMLMMFATAVCAGIAEREIIRSIAVYLFLPALVLYIMAWRSKKSSNISRI